MEAEVMFTRLNSRIRGYMDSSSVKQSHMHMKAASLNHMIEEQSPVHHARERARSAADGNIDDPVVAFLAVKLVASV
jgi:hypothetical protein